MPAQPAYFHRLTEALEIFRQLPLDWIDRRTLQETLGVSKTVAWRILRQCGGKDGPGNTVVCGREELILALERLQQTGRYTYEIRRRDRVESQLSELLALACSRHIQVAPRDRGVELLSTRFAHLPPGIDLSLTRLTIDFAGTQDFLQKLGAVMFAFQNDYDSISSFLEAAAPASSPTP
jgi:hypothetical protein